MACVLLFKPIAQYMCMQCSCIFAQYRLYCPIFTSVCHLPVCCNWWSDHIWSILSGKILHFLFYLFELQRHIY